jgi:hypothetical protein
MGAATEVFAVNSARMKFGPSELVRVFETESGDDDAELVDVSQFCFTMQCDAFYGRVSVLRASLEKAAELQALIREFERFVGPLKLFISY